MIDERLKEVKEIRETKNWEEVNTLVKNGWILICIYPTQTEIMYSMGRTKSCHLRKQQ